MGGSIGQQDGGNFHQVYDPQTNVWTNAAPMPMAMRHFGASVLRGRIYVVGGWLNGGVTPYTDTWVYDPILDTWTASAPCPEPRASFPLSMANGKIYAIGGSPRGHNITATATVYELTDYDLNRDDVIDAQDMSILVDHWHTDNPHNDITADGIIDTQDLVALSEHLFEDYRIIAHWMLDETGGDVAYDSATQNDGIVLGNPAWQPEGGQIGGALKFDGIDDVIIADPVLNPEDGPFSVFAWIKGGAPDQAIVSQQGGGNWLQADANGALMAELTKSGGRRTGVPLHSGTVITNDNWHRVGFVWDAKDRILYVDDVEVARDTLTGPDSGNGALYIGTGNGLAEGSFWSGMIDDVRIYNQAIEP